MSYLSRQIGTTSSHSQTFSSIPKPLSLSSPSLNMAGSLDIVSAQASSSPRHQRQDDCQLAKMDLKQRACKQPHRADNKWSGVTKSSRRFVDRCKHSMKGLPAKLKFGDRELRSFRLMLDEFSLAL